MRETRQGTGMKLRTLHEAATPFPHVIQRYEHGSGRQFTEVAGMRRQLIADYYTEGDRELFIYLRNHAADFIDLIEAAQAVLRCADPVARDKLRPALQPFEEAS